MDITFKVIRKGNTGYKKIYLCRIPTKKGQGYGKKEIFNKYDRR